MGLIDARFNKTNILEFISNMDGFPNGPRLEDDVTRIELQAVEGIVLAAIGLRYEDGSPGLVGALALRTGIEKNDTTFRTGFPYMQLPWPGTKAQTTVTSQATIAGFRLKPAIVAAAPTELSEPFCREYQGNLQSGH